MPNNTVATGGTAAKPSISKYGEWQGVIARIGELKASLASQFIGSSAFKMADGSFLIRMSAFFATRITSNSEDLAILRGVIAENEGVEPSDISLKIEGITQGSSGSLADELDNLIN